MNSTYMTWRKRNMYLVSSYLMFHNMPSGGLTFRKKNIKSTTIQDLQTRE